jgi:predicted TIM-barrel fold metal-dependent hydrolase
MIGPPRPVREVWTEDVVDADVHAVVPDIDALLPYIEPVWQQYIGERAFDAPMDYMVYPQKAPASVRDQWRPADGTVAASRLEHLAADVLDANGPSFAIVNCCYGVDQGHPDFAIALARAANDWLIAEWLDRDPRLRASIVLPGRTVEAMIDEIRRVGDHPGFVQALLPIRSGRLYGTRFWHPLFVELAQRRLVAGLHRGGTNDAAPPTPSGWPSWYIEEYVADMQVYESQIASIIGGGVLAAAPGIRFAMLEGGFTWVAAWGWRIDKDWKGMRREVPWVNTPPLKLIREHFRFTTAPMDAGPREMMEEIIGWLGPELLMYASDYPHCHDDDLELLLSCVPGSARADVMGQTARAWYGL